MRIALLLVLAACTTTHTLRMQVVDGETGRMLEGEKLTIRTRLRSSWCTDTQTDSKHWLLGRGNTSKSARTDSATTRVRSGRDGWAKVPMIERTGACRYRPTEVRVFARDALVAEIAPEERGPIVLPVFASGTPPRTTSPEPVFVTHRAKAAFTRIEAVRSVYAERFVRSDEVPVVFSSADPDKFLAGFASTPDTDGNDPFRRAVLARVRGDGLAWRVELSPLEVGADLHFVIPPLFAAQRDVIREWGRTAIAELVLRRARAEKLVDERAGIDVDATVENGSILATLHMRKEDVDEITVVRVALDRFAPVELVEYREERRSECKIEWLYHRVKSYLPDRAPPSEACETGVGCMLGLDRAGNAWRGSCSVADGVRRVRVWPHL